MSGKANAWDWSFDRRYEHVTQLNGTKSGYHWAKCCSMYSLHNILGAFADQDAVRRRLSLCNLLNWGFTLRRGVGVPDACPAGFADQVYRRKGITYAVGAGAPRNHSRIRWPMGNRSGGGSSLAACRAAANFAPLWKRSAGSLAMALRITASNSGET
jgi:hypothetical protein